MSNIIHLKLNANQPILSLSKQKLDEAFAIIQDNRDINETLAHEKTIVSLKKKEVDAFLLRKE